jgi:Alpha/beta hydrolase domain
VNFEGPITGGRHGRPWGSPLVDLASVGYIEEEWFVTGDAATYDFASGAEPTVAGLRNRRGATAPSSCRGAT